MRLVSAVRALANRTPLRWHVANCVTRIEMIQLACDSLRARRYLEIGVSSGQCFSEIRVAEKIGVDPIPPAPAVSAVLSRPGVSYHSLTSTAFFEQQAPRVLAKGVDVAFIDGLHTDQQSYEDCLNALRYLSPGGIVLMHDNLPISAEEAVPAQDWDEAKRVNGPAWNGDWTGDGWKAIVRLRALHRDVSACVFDSDHGVAAVWREPSPPVLAYSSRTIDGMTFDDLNRDSRRLLGLRAPAELTTILAGLRRIRSS
jgi:hypothetical protein